MGTRIIVCGHGTTSLAGRTALSRLVNAVRKQAPEYEVVDAFVDVQHPMLADVVTETSGSRIVVPLLLGHDRQADALLSAVAATDDGIRITSPIGPDWVLAEIGVRRLIEAGARPTDTIVLVAPHVDGPRALEDVSSAARLLSAVWGGPVHVGVVEGQGTPVDQALDIARAHNRRVVVALYDLTPGEGSARIGRLGADIVTAPLLAAGTPDPQLVSLALSRAMLEPPLQGVLGVGPREV